MQIKEIQQKDFKKVIRFAIQGMHFEEYLKNKFILNAYGQYFWYLEYTNATQVLAAYEGDKLLGVLVVDMKNEPKPYKSFWKSAYVKFVDVIQNLFFGSGVMPYNEANKAMYEKYTEQFNPDGEIRFLAANPDSKVKGVGTFLLNELTRIKQGKEIYLYTDTNCTYQFYEHRGFERIGEQSIVLELQGDVALKCLLYRKKL
ncbi:MAG: GNAT family N-acetyltransferase [Lactimicrobium sp.]|uniref:GNAT family N-acetyltransferase n=1 Tax=Lactimicrobium sp. TaxID=2563780 RepID=UPI002F3555A7